jgi:hypothetical protein
MRYSVRLTIKRQKISLTPFCAIGVRTLGGLETFMVPVSDSANSCSVACPRRLHKLLSEQGREG